MNQQYRYHPSVTWAAALYLVIAVAAPLATSSSSLAAGGVRQYCYSVRMRDGVELATNVFLPRLPRGSYPTVLVRTPYGKEIIGKFKASFACRRGFAVVVQDVRARFEPSGADAIVFISETKSEHHDGHDTIKWIAEQPWCDGNVGSWGPSAMGADANLLAPDAPDALKAQHVMMAFTDLYSQVVYQGGAFRKSLVETWLAEAHFGEENLRIVRKHPLYDQVWSRLNCETRAGRVNTPAVYWGGWHDAFTQGTINSFTTVHYQGGPGARGKCRLILGPWRHEDIRWLIRPRVMRCQPQEGAPFRFFDHHLKGVANGVASDKPVQYYVMGDSDDPYAPGNYWRSADHWPPLADRTGYYFHADGSLQPRAPAAENAKQSYKFDPTDPVPTLGGRNLSLPAGPMDQRPVETRNDVLLFTSNVLDEPVEVTGQIVARLFVSSDCPDTDFTVKLTDVYPDGRSMLLCDGILRASHRESSAYQRPLERGEVYQLTVDLWSTSYVLNKGHRIRVAVSSSNSPRFEPNPNNGELPDSDTPPQTATNTLHLSNRYPSHIVLPIYTGKQRPADYQPTFAVTPLPNLP